MKKKISFLLAILILLTACSTRDLGKKKAQSTTGDTSSTRKAVTVTTSFLADMVRQLTGNKVNIQTIIPAGEDPHLYMAKPDDLTKLETADLVLYHGLHFEGKMVEILEKTGVAVTKDFTPSEIGEMDEEGEKLTDPHFWFNIDLYKKAVRTASDEIQKMDPDNARQYEKNTLDYLKKLDELAQYGKEELAKIPKENRYLITPHDAFNYFSRYFDIPVMAPQGVSTDSEVGVADMDKTAQFIVDHKVKAIFAESTTDPKRMETLQEAVRKKGGDVKVVKGEHDELFSDSLAPLGQTGDNYIDMVKHNIDLMVRYLK